MTFIGILLIISVVVLITVGLLMMWRGTGFFRTLGIILFLAGIFLLVYFYIYPLLYIVFIGGPL